MYKYIVLQEINDIIKTKEDLHKLRKEYDDLKLSMIQVHKYIDSLIRFFIYNTINCFIVMHVHTYVYKFF